jgi:hypothetical protein
MRLVIQMNMKVMELSAEGSIMFYGFHYRSELTFLDVDLRVLFGALRRVKDVCFDVSEERTASCLHGG